MRHLTVSLLLTTLILPPLASANPGCTILSGCATLLNWTPYEMEYTTDTHHIHKHHQHRHHPKQLSSNHTKSTTDTCTFWNYPAFLHTKRHSTTCTAHALPPWGVAGGELIGPYNETVHGRHVKLRVGGAQRFIGKSSKWRKQHTENVRGFRFKAIGDTPAPYVAGDGGDAGTVTNGDWTWVQRGDSVVCTLEGGVPYCTWHW